MPKSCLWCRHCLGWWENKWTDFTQHSLTTGTHPSSLALYCQTFKWNCSPVMPKSRLWCEHGSGGWVGGGQTWHATHPSRLAPNHQAFMQHCSPRVPKHPLPADKNPPKQLYRTNQHRCSSPPPDRFLAGVEGLPVTVSLSWHAHNICQTL